MRNGIVAKAHLTVVPDTQASARRASADGLAHGDERWLEVRAPDKGPILVLSPRQDERPSASDLLQRTPPTTVGGELGPVGRCAGRARDVASARVMSKVVVIDNLTLDGGDPFAAVPLADAVATATGVVITTYQSAQPAAADRAMAEAELVSARNRWRRAR